MKIAVFTTYFDPEENGLTRYINGLYGALILKHPDIKVDIIAFDTLRTRKYKERTKNWRIYRIDCIPILGRTYAIPTIKGLRQLKKILEKSGSGRRPEPTSSSYDIINTHTRFFLSSYLGVKYGKKYGTCPEHGRRIPVIHTEHGSGFVKHRIKLVELIAKLYDLTLGKYVLKNADLICGVSESACRFAKKLGAKETEVVYNGIDLEFWKKCRNEASSRSNVALPHSYGDTNTVFTFVGRLIPEKGVQDLVGVLYSLSFRPLSRNPDSFWIPGSRKARSRMTTGGWELLIIGDGFYRKELEKLVKKYQLQDQILFLGAKSQKEIRDILNITDLFVNPSLASEGLPTTILEAGACGCRVLSSDKGGSAEVLKKENLYRAGNLEKLKEKILNYKKIPVPKVGKFDWENIADKYHKIISQKITV